METEARVLNLALPHYTESESEPQGKFFHLLRAIFSITTEEKLAQGIYVYMCVCVFLRSDM